MPGAIPHITAGILLFILGSIYFKDYFKQDNTFKKLFFLLVVCLFFSFIPDIFLIIHYIGNVFSFCSVIPYHNLLHIIFFVISIIFLLLLKFVINIKNKPIWIMGMWCLLVHITMDLIIPDTGMNIWI